MVLVPNVHTGLSDFVAKDGMLDMKAACHEEDKTLVFVTGPVGFGGMETGPILTCPLVFHTIRNTQDLAMMGHAL
jgi:hypothetical protein